MKIFFLVLLGAYIAYSVVINRREQGVNLRRPPVALVLLQTPLLVLAFYFAAQRGVFSRDLVSPVRIGLGVVVGHLVFGISLLITHRNLQDAAWHFVDFGSLWRFLVEIPGLLLRFFGVSFIEEMIFRVNAQAIVIEWTQHPLLAIILVAAAFSAVHQHFFRNPPVQSIEFAGFALLLGALYYWTNSLVLVMVVHTLRNLESLYLDYLVKVDELGDETLAMQAIEKEHAPTMERS